RGNRHGQGRVTSWQGSGAAPPCSSNHRHAAAGDRGHASSTGSDALTSSTKWGAPMRARTLAVVLAGLTLALVQTAPGGQVPGEGSAPKLPISGRDRVYLSDQTSNTVSVVNPEANSLLGVIRLGEIGRASCGE